MCVWLCVFSVFWLPECCAEKREAFDFWSCCIPFFFLLISGWFWSLNMKQHIISAPPFNGETTRNTQRWGKSLKDKHHFGFQNKVYFFFGSSIIIWWPTGIISPVVWSSATEYNALFRLLYLNTCTLQAWWVRCNYLLFQNIQSKFCVAVFIKSHGQMKVLQSVQDCWQQIILELIIDVCKISIC